MSEAGGDNITQRVGTAVGVLAALLILRRLRKRRKEKKMLKARARARAREKARAVELRVKEEKAREKARKKSGEKAGKGKKGKKERSIPEQLIRFTILAVAKKIISQQIEAAGKDLGSSKLGKKVVEASGA